VNDDHLEPTPGPRISDVVLERYLLGELDDAEANRIRRMLAKDESLARRLDDIATSDEEIRRSYPAEALARGVTARLENRRKGQRDRLSTIVWWAVPAVAALVIVAVTLRWTPEDGVRAKGEAASLLIYRSTNGSSEPLSDNDVAHTGDVIRIGYRASERGFGTIVSVDGRGVMTRHLPTDGTQAAPLDAGRVVLLDNAFELDDAPIVERFYLITAPQPFDVVPVVEAIRRAIRREGTRVVPELPRSMTVVTFSLRKDSKP
jgi:hypothetical protein